MENFDFKGIVSDIDNAINSNSTGVKKESYDFSMVERLVLDYIDLENKLLNRVFVSLLKRNFTPEDIIRLNIQKIFGFISDKSSYDLSIEINGDRVIIGRVVRNLDIEFGIYKIDFIASDEGKKYLDQEYLLYDNMEPDMAHSILNNELKDCEEGQRIYRFEGDTKYYAFFIKWVSNTRILVRFGPNDIEDDAKGWMKSVID